MPILEADHSIVNFLRRTKQKEIQMSTKVTWYGHAALGLETDGYKVIVDPFLEGNPAASTSPDSVDADYMLISHGHGDHVGDTLSIAQRTGAMVISNDEIAN